MRQKFDFNDLFILDMANNHQGDFDHGVKIIEEMASIVDQHGLRTGIKFQFRQLDTFIHPDFKEDKERPHIHRFISTRLDNGKYRRLVDHVHKKNLISICTPFDEESVDVIEDLNIEIIKVASCSIKDWPLLERIAESGKPVIASTGGAKIEDIDNVASFFRHRGVHFAFMHCVSIYPTPDEYMNLSVIEHLRDRYPKTTIGWSTHETPVDMLPVALAVAKGAKMFERHVGVETDQYKLNKYSSTPEQIDRWMQEYKRARDLCGFSNKPPSPEVEQDSLKSLQRGVYLKEPLPKGTKLEREHIFFAMPYNDGQMASEGWTTGIILKRDIDVNEPIMEDDIDLPKKAEEQILKSAIHEISAMLNEAKIVINSDFEVEYSHHYGLKEFRDTGAVIITCINRSYAKKLVIQLPGQSHPNHFHKIKEESFQVLYGVLHVEIDGHHRILHPGEICLIQNGVWHSFWTDTGVIFEEISTKHYNDDSYYEDKTINTLKREDRKTVVDHWGRFQILPTCEQ